MKGRQLTHLLNGAGILAISGCASAQVNYNTLDIGSTYDTLIIKQVVFNIFKTLENKFGIPAFVNVTAQSANTTDAVNPTLTFPFSPTTTLTQTAASLTTGKTLATAARGISLTAQAQWNQTYTLTTVDDPDQLRRLRSIYQFVTGHMDYRDFESDYPIIEVSGSSGSSSSNPTIVSGSFAGSPFKVTIGGNNPPKGPTYVRRACLRADKAKCIVYTWISIKPDKTFIQKPGCILCDYGYHPPGYPDQNAIALEKNVKLQQGWFYLPDEPLGSDATALTTTTA